MNKKHISSFISPIHKLSYWFCFVVTFTLWHTVLRSQSSISQPQESNKAKSNWFQRQRRIQVRRKARSSSKNKIYVTEASKAVNGSGVVVTVNSNSYGGTLTAMVGIDSKVNYRRWGLWALRTHLVSVQNQDPKHLGQYKGPSDLGSEIYQGFKSKVKYITGASISSGAIHESVLLV